MQGFPIRQMITNDQSFYLGLAYNTFCYIVTDCFSRALDVLVVFILNWLNELLWFEKRLIFSKTQCSKILANLNSQQ